MRRSGSGWPCLAACSCTTPHAWPMAAKPSASDIDSDSSDDVVLPGEARPRRRDHGGHRHLGVRVGVRAHLQAAVADREPVGLAGDRLLGREQRQDRLEALLHHPPLVDRVDAHDVRVGGERARAAPEDQAAAGEVVEQRDAVGQQPRVVVRERHDAGAELDVLGPLRRRGDEDLGAADDLVAARVVLAEPGLVVAEPIERLDPLEVVLEGERRALPDGWNGA